MFLKKLDKFYALRTLCFQRAFSFSREIPAEKPSFSNQANQQDKVFTWGSHVVGTGQITVRCIQPLPLKDISNVAKVSMGPQHTLALTNEGKVYSFGAREYGVLGNILKKRKHMVTPQEIAFFTNQNEKIVDVAAGCWHSLAVNDKGNVYSWGYGGNVFLAAFLERYGPLGKEKVQRPAKTPQIIESLANEHVVSVAAGDNFSYAICKNGNVYNWGDGSSCVFAEESSVSYAQPTLNAALDNLKKKKNLTVKKLKAAGRQVVALMSDNHLYSWGDCTEGALGAKKSHWAVVGETTVSSPLKVSDHNVVDYDLSQNTLIYYTDKNEVYWSGLQLRYQPLLQPLPNNKKVKAVGAATDSYAIVTEDDVVYTRNSFIESDNLLQYPTYDLQGTRATTFGGAKIKSIGGSYLNRYAIVAQRMRGMKSKKNFF